MFWKNQTSSHFLYGAECSEYFEFNWIIFFLVVRQMGTAKSAADLFLVKMVVSLKITVMWRTHPQKFKCSTKKFYNKQLCTIVLFVHCPHFHTLIFQRKTYLSMKHALFIISGLLLMHLNVLEKDLFYILLFEWIE